MFPDDSLQSLIQPSDWWIKNENKTLCRGALLFSFAPHIDQIPYTFEPVGRSQATEHNSAIVRVSPLKVDQPLEANRSLCCGNAIARQGNLGRVSSEEETMLGIWF